MKGQAPTIGDRMACGEECADHIAAHLPGLPAVEPKDAAEPSVVAPPTYESDVVVCGGGTAGAVACVVSLPDNKVTFGPYFFAGAAAVGLGDGGFELRDSSGRTLRNLPAPAGE